MWELDLGKDKGSGGITFDTGVSERCPDLLGLYSAAPVTSAHVPPHPLHRDLAAVASVISALNPIPPLALSPTNSRRNVEPL